MQIFFDASRAYDFARSAVTRVSTLLSLLLPAVMLTIPFVANAEVSARAGSDNRPVVYLTFDDGPSADMVTDELLHVLARHNATATFFVTGQRVRREPDKIAQIVYAGHAIGNHTHSHAKLTEVSDAQALSELKTASEVILAAGGPPPTCFRPPFGSTDNRINKIASRLGLVPVGWSIDTRDWEKSTSIEAIAQALNRTSQDSIVLLHDGPSYRGKMLLAFSAWMETEAHRFQFRALPECGSGGGVVQLAEVRLPETRSSETRSSETQLPETQVPKPQLPKVQATAEVVATYAQETAVPEPVAVVSDWVPPVANPNATIPELLAKIRAYRFDLYEDGQRVDLTQVTATLNTEIHGEHVFYSF